MRDVERRLIDLERRLANLVRLGRVAEADYEGALVRVASGDLLTGWLPWLTRRAGTDVDWWAPEVGEQVVVVSPFGEPSMGVVMAAVYQQAHPAPETSPDVRRVGFADGTTITHDRVAHRMSISCAGDLAIVVQGVVTLQGNLSVTGNINASGSIIDGGGNTPNHSH